LAKLGICWALRFFKKRVTICKENNAEIVDEKRGKYQEVRNTIFKTRKRRKQGRGKKRNLGRVI
jgi:hypothetical protein